MKINILTLFPEYFREALNTSMMRKAQKIRALKIKIYNLRDFGIGPVNKWMIDPMAAEQV